MVLRLFSRAFIITCAYFFSFHTAAKYMGESAATCPIIGAVSISQGYDNRRALRILLESSFFYSRAITRKWTSVIRQYVLYFLVNKHI